MIKYKLKMKDGKEVTVTEWQAENPKALLQISHGMVEHAGRYNEFAEYMAKNGYTVFADDHRAHGETDKDTLGYLWVHLVSHDRGIQEPLGFHLILSHKIRVLIDLLKVITGRKKSSHRYQSGKKYISCFHLHHFYRNSNYHVFH